MNRLWLLPAISFFLPAAFTVAQDQAELLFSNAATFMNAGKYKEGLADYENIVDNFPDSKWAPEALLEIGNYYLNVESAHQTALTYYARIQKNYSDSEAAPAAYYYKAVILDKDAQDRETLTAALADLVRMMTFYKGHSREDAVFFLAARLNYRLGDYTIALSLLQRLEFFHPRSKYVPAGLILGAKCAYLTGNRSMATLMLARLQRTQPDTPEATSAESYLALLDRFGDRGGDYEPDRNFFGAEPKTFSNPTAVHVVGDRIGIVGNREVQLGPITGGLTRLNLRGLNDITSDNEKRFLMVAKTQITSPQVTGGFAGLNAGGQSLGDMRSAAVDNYGRVYVVDDDLKTLSAFSRSGEFLTHLLSTRPKLVRTFESEIWALDNGERRIVGFGDDFKQLERSLPGFVDVVDFRFDAFGNAYVLSEKGRKLSIHARDGQLKATLDLESGALPIRQAAGLAVDDTGAVYISDRRNGSVIRFH